jgi:predicted CXXCH cytochrome family protein
MKFLLRFITQNAAGSVECTDKLVDAPAITIGRATDQVLHIRDRRARLQHAKIAISGGVASISTSALVGVIVNGRSQRECNLAVGDVIEVGANILRVIDAPDAADFAISFELGPDASGANLAPAWSGASISDGLSKRRLAWISAVTVLVLALLIPASGLLHPGIASFLRSSALLPDDGLWLAGPVHSVHATFSTDCQSCHNKLFTRVTDDACLGCHEVSRHVATADSDIRSDWVPTPVLGEARCASCHLEHNEPPSLVRRHQGLCADCHSDLPAGSSLESASDFLDAHPRFKVSLLQPARNASGEVQWTTEHVLLAEALSAEHSNLKFNHQVHLDPGGIVTPEGNRVLECGTCHQIETGGARMLPISMDQHCSDCHSLVFDPDDPNREVPHGDPERVLQVLVEYYSARLLGADPDAVNQRLRRPGQALSRADRDRAAAEARVKALEVAEDLFERRACINCHEVSRVAADSDMPWRVQPVQLTEVFFPLANFSHAAHDTEATACGSCHKAETSTLASDLLMPGIETCRDCHGSGASHRNDSSQIPSGCVMCHSFHFSRQGSYAGDG